jgi:hypothetical protein
MTAVSSNGPKNSLTGMMWKFGTDFGLLFRLANKSEASG